MKKFLAFFLFLLLLTLTTGCQFVEKVNVRKEMVTYIDSMNKIIDQLAVEERSYKEDYVEEEENDEAFTYIEEQYIPAYEQAIKEIKAIPIETEEMQEIRTLIVQAYQLNIQAVKTDKEAYETGDKELTLKYDEIETKMEELYARHDDEMKRLGEEYGVEITFEEERG
ncbi:hypothetical protein WAK64_06555 [Bacillus spongiae]|uniref:Lipoprotein n=1 Tax=Bacillus spongiae TaxID=2683610 RepID=A0ABU8HC38_9BACI